VTRTVSSATLLRRRELAHRTSGGIDVTLYWSIEEGTTVEVWQAATEELMVFAVAPDRALDAYYHPFAHLPLPPVDLVPATWP
jgi:hypothetical protein